jgi:hypothetical protein
MLSVPLIPTVQSIEVEKEINNKIKLNSFTYQTKLVNGESYVSSFISDLIKILINFLRCILAILILPLTFIISIPGFIILFLDTILFFIVLHFSYYPPVTDLIQLLGIIWKLFQYIGIYLSIPFLIDMMVIDSRGYQSFMDCLENILYEFKPDSFINLLISIFDEYLLPVIKPI